MRTRIFFSWLIAMGVLAPVAYGRDIPAYSSIGKTNATPLTEQLRVYWSVTGSQALEALGIPVTEEDLFHKPLKELTILAYTNHFYVVGIAKGYLFGTRCSSLVQFVDSSVAVNPTWQGELPQAEIQKIRDLAKKKSRLDSAKALEAATAFLNRVGFNDKILSLLPPTVSEIEMVIPKANNEFTKVRLPIYSVVWKSSVGGDVSIQVSGVDRRIVRYENTVESLPKCGDESYRKLLDETVGAEKKKSDELKNKPVPPQMQKMLDEFERQKKNP